MFSVLFSRISEVGAVLPRCRSTAKYHPERGSEGSLACGCHTQKLCLSVRQRHFNLHSKYTFSLFSLLLFLPVVQWKKMLFEITTLLLLLPYSTSEMQTQFHLWGCFLSQAQRVPVRKNHAEPIAGPVGKMQDCCSCYLIKPNGSLSLCLFILMWHVCFIPRCSCQRHSIEQMDSTESPGHQTSAHVCYGQCNVHVIYFCIIMLVTVTCFSHNSAVFRNGICQHSSHHMLALPG